MIIFVFATIAILLFLITLLINMSWEIKFNLRTIAGIAAILALGLSIPAFFINQCAASSTATYRIQYETLIYQLENGAYENVVEYSRKELMDDIYDYNAHVTSGRILSKNAWVGVYYPEDWDNLPLIELEKYK